MLYKYILISKEFIHLSCMLELLDDHRGRGCLILTAIMAKCGTMTWESILMTHDQGSKKYEKMICKIHFPTYRYATSKIKKCKT